MFNIYCIRPKGFNIGNDVIFLALRYLLQKSFDEEVNIITLPATNKYETHCQAGFTAQNIYEMNQYGDGVIVGGGNLYENGELTVDLNALSKLDVPLMLFSLSRGRIYNRKRHLVERTDAMSDHLLKSLNQQAMLSLVRDEATLRYLKKLGCHPVLGACPTLFLNEIPQPDPAPFTTTAPDLLISIRNPRLMSIPIQDQFTVKENILSLSHQFRELGYKNIKLFCHDFRDIPFAASFEEENIDYIYTNDPFEYLSLLKNTRLNISYRLHSVLPCLSYGTPVIKISYDERALSLMKTIGLETWNIDMIRERNVVSAVMDRFGKLETLKKETMHLRKKWQRYKRVILDSFDLYAKEVSSRKNKVRHKKARSL